MSPANPAAPRTPEPVDLGTMSVRGLCDRISDKHAPYCAGRADCKLPHAEIDELARRAALSVERSQILEVCAKDCEAEAARLRSFIRGQSSFYVQYEDQGHSSIRAQAFQDAAARIRALDTEGK